MAANYIQALGLQRLQVAATASKENNAATNTAAHNATGSAQVGRTRGPGVTVDNDGFVAAASYATAADTPLVVLEDDVLVAAHFQLRLERLLRGLRKVLPEGSRYILSLYMPYDEAERAAGEAEPVAPGIVKYPPEWFYATQGLVFSDGEVRSRLVKFYLSKCVNVPLGWNDERQMPNCEGSDMIIQMFLQAVAKAHDPRRPNSTSNHPGGSRGGDPAIGTGGGRIELYGTQHALLQHLSKSGDTTVGSSSQPHRVQNYVDSRKPCRGL